MRVTITGEGNGWRFEGVRENTSAGQKWLKQNDDKELLNGEIGPKSNVKLAAEGYRLDWSFRAMKDTG
jgi:hypothetical protein